MRAFDSIVEYIFAAQVTDVASEEVKSPRVPKTEHYNSVM